MTSIEVSEEHKPRVREVLQGTRDFFDTHGWTQGTYYAPIDRRSKTWPEGIEEACLVGALNIKLAETGADWPVIHDTCRVVESVIGDLSITAWNDQPYRTKDEVIWALDLAISEVS